MAELTSFQVAQIKRTWLSTKPFYTKRDKLIAKIEELTQQLNTINADIDLWEAPIKQLTGGLSSRDCVQLLEAGINPLIGMGCNAEPTNEEELGHSQQQVVGVAKGAWAETEVLEVGVLGEVGKEEETKEGSLAVVDEEEATVEVPQGLPQQKGNNDFPF